MLYVISYQNYTYHRMRPSTDWRVKTWDCESIDNNHQLYAMDTGTKLAYLVVTLFLHGVLLYRLKVLTYTPPPPPFTLALLIRSKTGFAPMRPFTLHQLIRISDLNWIKLNHRLEVVSDQFSLLRVLIASVDATRTRTKAEQIWPIQCWCCIRIYDVACLEYSRSRGSARLSTQYYYKFRVAILLLMRVKRKPVVIYNSIAM